MDAKKRVLCPSCFGLWEPEPVDVDGAEPATPRATPRWARTQQSHGLLSRTRSIILRLLGRAPLPGRTGGRTLACPNRECGATLPPGADETDTIVIGLVGGISTGKTMYLTALLNALVQRAELSGNGCHFTPLGDSATRYLDFERRLFGERRPIALTPSGVGSFGLPPLAFRMTVNNDGVTRAYNLLMFDASGEQLQRPESLHTNCRYVKSADGLMFMVDPAKLGNVTQEVAPEVLGIARPAAQVSYHANGVNGGHSRVSDVTGMLAKTSLAAGGPTGTTIVTLPRPANADTPEAGDRLFDAPITVSEPSSGAGSVSAPPAVPMVAQAAALHIPAHFILSSVAQAIRDAQGLAPGVVVPTKAAIVITKADVLRYMSGVKDLLGKLGWPGAPMIHYNHVQTLQDAVIVSEILDRIAGPMMGTASAREFERPSFHVTSATGVPIKSNGEFGMVRPYRVSDPLASILYRLDVIR